VNGASIAHFGGRQRRRLTNARETGYLNAACQGAEMLIAAHARWCWRLHVPVVWTERLSPRSRFGRVRLDLFTTPYRLSAEGQVELQEIAPGAVTSPHDARWSRVALRDLDWLAAAVLRIATRSENLQPLRTYPAGCPARAPAQSAPILRRLAATG